MLILGLVAMNLGDVRAWRELRDEMAAMETPESARMEREFAVALLNVSQNGRGIYPKWIELGDFTGLRPELFPAARFLYLKLLYVKWKEVELQVVAEPLISESHRERCDLSEVYLRVMAAVACFDHGNTARAGEHLDAAAELAMPLGLIQPFLEYRRELPRVMDACLRQRYPQELARIKKQMKSFVDNWTRLYSEMWAVPMAAELTPREFEACQLVSRGMAVGEISRRMGISRSSVKKYLNVAYSKLGVEDKNQLRRYIHT